MSFQFSVRAVSILSCIALARNALDAEARGAVTAGADKAITDAANAVGEVPEGKLVELKFSGDLYNGQQLVVTTDSCSAELVDANAEEAAPASDVSGVAVAPEAAPSASSEGVDANGSPVPPSDPIPETDLSKVATEDPAG